VREAATDRAGDAAGEAAVRVLIVEDEPLARQKLRVLVDEVPWLACAGEAGDGSTALRLIDELEPDLVLLDIELPELDGLTVLARAEHTPAVIFTTAYDHYAVSAFELAALDYLLKPFGRERFQVAVERARRTLEAGAPSTRERAQRALGARDAPLDRILVRDRGRITPVALAEIERLEAEDDYVAVIAGGRRFLVYLPLAEFERRLDARRFVRVHRSHIVNLDFVRHLVPFDAGRLQVEMRDGTRILASRARSRALRDLAL
jgi:two-component system LytT family response regulator